MVVEISEEGPVEAGSEELYLSCTVQETIFGLTNAPTAQWVGPSGLVSSGEDVAVTVIQNSTTTISTLTFSSLHTSHAGQYVCEGILQTPAPAGIITTTSISSNVIVRSELLAQSCFSHYPCILFL